MARKICGGSRIEHPKRQPDTDKSTAKTELELTLFYGQSWISGIGPNKRRIVGEKFPDTAVMFDDGCGVKGWCGKMPTDTHQEYIPAQELEKRTQSVQIPYLFRRAKRAELRTPYKLVAARSEGVPGASMRRLCKDSPSTGASVFGYENLVTAIKLHVNAAEKLNQTPTIPFVVWCQGAGDGRKAYAYYRESLSTLFDQISTTVLEKTGQSAPPTFLILQPPGRSWGGDWKCLQVMVDIAFERDDCVLATAGWAFEQYDRVHFSGKGAVMAGELLQLVARGLETDDWISAPFLMNYQRDGRTVTAQVGGPHDILVDQSIKSPRHYVGDAPVPNYGFTAYGAEIENVEVGPRKVTLTLDRADGPLKIGYAWHAGDARAKDAGTEKNQSSNRGTLRADWSERSMFEKEPLYQWLASGYHKFEE